MPIPAQVQKLVERFQLYRADYHKDAYNETALRNEFLDVFWTNLGWDVNNSGGAAPSKRDATLEFALKVEDEGLAKSRRPDYAFRVGEVSDKEVFFVEAKKPSVNVRNDPKPAYQIRSYGFNAKLPFCVLSDFEEFAVYDCRFQPILTDGAEKARVNYWTCEQYADNWDEIEALFGREAVAKGALARRAALEQKRGTTTVDALFLKLIGDWRERLARDLIHKNPKLSAPNLNYAVQMTLDRIIFLRMAEDRDLEPWGTLQNIARKPNVYAALCDLFREADITYNSGLFHFAGKKRSGAKKRPGFEDTLTPELTISDVVLSPFISGLYRPSPFNFRVMPIEILGQAYEQFLGKTIRIAETGPRVPIIEEKPEVRKSRGVYYTPAYIVDAIVSQTVGALCEGKTPRQIESLRVLDPACGSGSFLIGAYGFLLNWHLDYYLSAPEKHLRGRDAPLYMTDGGAESGFQYRLTTREKRRILLNNIYGVDIDPQAVEVTKLSLLLRVLEDESSDQLKLLNEPALPDLDDNIRCGNSLIGPDFYDESAGGVARATLSDAEQTRINEFDWSAAFPSVLKSGGFDAVIGNPPYVDSEYMSEYAPLERAYCTSRYASASGNWDLFCAFVGKSVELCKSGGYQSLILPNKLGSASYAAGARQDLVGENRLVAIQDYSAVPVFPVSVYPIVYVAQKSKPDAKSSVKYERMAFVENHVERSQLHQLNHAEYFGNSAQPWRIFGNLQSDNPAERLRNKFPPLSSVATVLGAATVGEAYKLSPLLEDSEKLKDGDLKLVNSGTIDRYDLMWGRKGCRYLGETYENPIVPANATKDLPDKRNAQATTAKIIVAGMTKVLECGLDSEGDVLAAKSTTIILSELNLYFLLGVLNSKLVNFYYDTMFGGNKLQGGYLRIGPPQLKTIPLPTLDMTSADDVATHGAMVKLVGQMLDLQLQFAGAGNPQEKSRLATRIKSTDAQIDALVFALYGLDEGEIALVNGL